jgi:rhodanese-related sulfurtransferase
MTQTLPERDGAATIIDAPQLRRLLTTGHPVRLLDVRTPGEFAAGHIAGAINIPLDQLKAVAGRLSDPALGDLVVICQAGARAATACEVLTAAGHRGPILLTGGMNAWQGAGGPSNQLRGKWSLERQVRFVAGLIVSLSVGASIAWTPASYLAGVVGAGLVFASVTNTCAMGMLLAKLPYNRGSSCAIDTAVSGLQR